MTSRFEPNATIQGLFEAELAFDPKTGSCGLQPGEPSPEDESDGVFRIFFIQMIEDGTLRDASINYQPRWLEAFNSQGAGQCVEGNICEIAPDKEIFVLFDADPNELDIEADTSPNVAWLRAEFTGDLKQVIVRDLQLR
jgi:hypothetical protein